MYLRNTISLVRLYVLSAIEVGRGQLDTIGVSVGTDIELKVTFGAVDADATFGGQAKRLSHISPADDAVPHPA